MAHYANTPEAEAAAQRDAKTAEILSKMCCTPREFAKAAFYQTDMLLSDALSHAYPTGCTLAQAIDWAMAMPWHVVEHREGRFSPFYLARTIQPGEVKLIDGSTAYLASGVSAWSGCSLMPSFTTAELAGEWLTKQGFNLVR